MVPPHRLRAPSPERLFARVWAEEGFGFPTRPEPQPPRALTPTGPLIDIGDDDQPTTLVASSPAPGSISHPGHSNAGATASPSLTRPATSRGPTIAATPPSGRVGNSSNTEIRQTVQNGASQAPRRGVPDSTIGQAPRSQRQGGPIDISPQQGPRPGSSTRARYGSEHAREPVGKKNFPKPLPLITTRQATTANLEKEKKERAEVYLGQPSNSSMCGVEGIYVWKDRAHRPTQLLGFTLEDLNHIRLQYKVWIRWNEDLSSVVIMSKAGPGAENNVLAALDAVRQDYANAKARIRTAAPVYIMVPPSFHAIRSFLKPVTYEPGLTMIELYGQPYVGQNIAVWNRERTSMVNSGKENIKNHLAKHIQAMAVMKGWMRMRVHFGHLNFTSFPKEFLQGRCDFKGFIELLENPRIQAGAKFDRKLLNPLSALKLKGEIEAMPAFCSVFGPATSAKEATFKESVCLFFDTSQGIPVRLEMDVDHSEVGGYQPGSIQCFRNNRRNKHLEILQCDIEKKIDWSLELITDNKIKDPEPGWEDFISHSIIGSRRQDSLGLPYPGIMMRYDDKIHVYLAVTRSKISYMLAESGYHIDITIYREWASRSRESPNTIPEPVIKAGVTMYHPDWDHEMMSIEETTNQRSWDPELSQIFGKGETKYHGIDHFLAEVEKVVGLLSNISREDFDALKTPSS
ncbi:hypothetical protein HYALB_00001047 [Hymenoscyphus albidus]|uniref:DUF7905 domain-containing protein n=1 Tax=Hymenoscyphus albidus TaxID=595503 RepID=A0A9N9M210_9HELO|nr:hypothetical protein HYALB_00001047 [Hymenoscyphus albidus]